MRRVRGFLEGVWAWGGFGSHVLAFDSLLQLHLMSQHTKLIQGGIGMEFNHMCNLII